MPGLLVHDGINEENQRDLQLYVIPSGEVFHIGTSETCDIILDDPEVSKIHASLNATPNGIWRVKLVDPEGTLRVNAKEVELKKLRNGDRIEMGNSSLQFFDMVLIGDAKLLKKETLPPKKEREGALVDAPLSQEGEDLLHHAKLKPPGIYLTHGGILGEFIHLQGQVLLGRSSQCTLVFRDVDVSRTHASLEVNSSNKVILTDLASRNGVYVNDRRIVDRCELAGFDLIRMGNTEFIFLETENNMDMFQKLVRRGSILLKKVSSAGGGSQGLVPGGDEKDDSPASPQKKSLIDVFKKGEERAKEERNREEEEDDDDDDDREEEKAPEKAPPANIEGTLVTSNPCSHCGESNVQRAKFCNSCGSEMASPK